MRMATTTWGRACVWAVAVVLLGATAGCAKSPTTGTPEADAAAVQVAADATFGAATDAGAVAGAPLDGEALYLKYCALCHGKRAEGYAADNAPSLISPQFRTTASPEFLRAAIRRGRTGTAMAGYDRALGGPLGTPEVEAILDFVLHKAPPQPAPQYQPLANRPANGDAVRGQQVYTSQCATCHGTPTQRLNAIHLFNPILLATASDEYLRLAILNGRYGTRMESWKAKLSPAQVEDVVTYLRASAVAPSPAPAPPPGPQQPAGLGAPLTQTGQPAPIPSGVETAPEVTGPVVLHPNGKAPVFHLKDDRIAPLDEVAKAYKDKARMVFVDARAPSDFNRLHITGAIPVPYYEPKELSKIPNDGTWVIAYCACPHHASGAIVDELRKRGYKHTAVLDEGIFAWKTKGHPVVEAPNQLPTPAPPPVPTIPPPGAQLPPPPITVPARGAPPAIAPPPTIYHRDPNVTPIKREPQPMPRP